jgi:hypothetical protein
MMAKAMASPENAFATTMTMLSKLERRRRFDTNEDVQEEDTNKATTLSAMATMLVMDDLVVAATVLDNRGSGALEVLVTANARRDGRIPTADIPTIVEPDAPSYIDDISQIEDYIQEP